MKGKKEPGADCARSAKRLITISLLCTSLLRAQNETSVTAESVRHAGSRAAIPVFDVKLLPDSELSVPYDDRMPSHAAGCDSNGVPYVRITKLFPHDISFLRLGPKEIVTFSANKITDVDEPDVVDGVFSGSGLYMLVEGGAHKKRAVKQLENGEQQVYFETEGERHSYIARFDEDGSYKGILKLDPPFRPTRLSGFESGGFLLAGFDDRKIWRVALLDSSGDFLKYVDFPKEKEPPDQSSEHYFGSTASPDVASGMFADFASFFPYRDSVLYVRGHSGSPMYQIRESGEVRRVKIKPPSGRSVEGFIPSDRNWLVDFGKVGGLPNREDSALYEVDLATGELLHYYRVEQYSRFSEADQEVACVYQGEFRAIRHENGRLMMLRGMPESSSNRSTPVR